MAWQLHHFGKMGRLRPGHFSLAPTDSDGGRTFQPKISSSSDGGELTYHFTAEVSMSEEAYRRMALNKFKGVYWLEGEDECQQRNDEFYKQGRRVDGESSQSHAE